MFFSMETLRFLKQLFKDTYRKDGAYREERDRVMNSLYPKAWLIHLCINATRIVYPILGMAQWQKAYDTSDEIEKLD